MQELSSRQEACLRALLGELIDQRQARILIAPYRAASGFWFGGGNLVQDGDGVIWLSGRYRNAGDSRTGLVAGARGLECALYRSGDGGASFQQVRSWSKADLSRGAEVLSIEGTALHPLPDGTWELFISSEKAAAYPDAVKGYQKPGTGVWNIDRIIGASPAALDPATLEPVLNGLDRPAYLHVKDPVVFDDPGGRTWMIFCSHPFCWTSSNTGLALRCGQGSFAVHSWQMVPRGPAWDVAVTRVTSRMPVPRVGCFAAEGVCAVYFYDGAECVRAHEQSALAHRRLRGYSCEEIGGALWGWEERFPEMERLSRLEPMFVSPWGTGCSRYVHVLTTPQGLLATWQQSQEDLSQPLVGRWMPMEQVGRILSG